MIKAWFVTLLFLLLFVLAYMFDVFALFTYSTAFYSALILVVIMLVVAGFVLGNPLAGKKEDDENGK